MSYNDIKTKIIYLDKNCGHGFARRKSVEESNCEYVALMDSDDVCNLERFAKQMPLFEEGFDVVGGQIAEFNGTIDNIIGYRRVELENKLIYQDLKKRCPFNQVTCVFKKSTYNKAGGYLDWFCDEDYYLWIRMAKINAKFANVPDILNYVRFQPGDLKRRRGKKYFKSEIGIQKLLLKEKMISKTTYLINCFKRFLGEMILNYIFPHIYFAVARTKKVPYINIVKDDKHKLESYKPFSVCMCSYHGDRPEQLAECLESIFNQTLKPFEVIMVVDGPVSKELDDVLKKYF